MSALHSPDTRWPKAWPQPSAHALSSPRLDAPDAGPALLALLAALDGNPSPCDGDERWTSEQPADLDVAAEGCARCPAVEQCHRYAMSVRPVLGTWGARRWTGNGSGPGRLVNTTTPTSNARRRSA